MRTEYVSVHSLCLFVFAAAEHFFSLAVYYRGKMFCTKLAHSVQVLNT